MALHGSSAFYGAVFHVLKNIWIHKKLQVFFQFKKRPRRGVKWVFTLYGLTVVGDPLLYAHPTPNGVTLPKLNGPSDATTDKLIINVLTRRFPNIRSLLPIHFAG